MLTQQIAVQQLRAQAEALGFPMFGIAEAREPDGFRFLEHWLDRGYAGGMDYIRNRHQAYQHPDNVLIGCQSVIMLGMPYPRHDATIQSKTKRPESLQSVVADDSQRALLGSYACGQVDYHDLIRDRLSNLANVLLAMFPEAAVRGVVDTAPLMERDFAKRAGLGWIGKNTLLLNRKMGSYFFLAALLTDVALPASDPFIEDHCGTCQACLDICPTDAFVEPHVLNASKCISYLTIEHRGVIDESLMARMGPWIFGCDVCQIVCPWNRKPEPNVDSQLSHCGMEERQDCEHWLRLDEATFRKRYRKTPFWRTKLVGMQRNALIVAANTNRVDLIGLIELFAHHSEPALARTASWALSRLLH